MSNAESILAELKTLGKESYRHVMVRNHGAGESCIGVPISELQKIRKREKVNHALALSLYATGIYDAMYLAGLIADDAQMTKADLDRWVSQAFCGGLSGAAVPWVAAGGPYAMEMARKWMDSPVPHVAEAGWATVAALVSVKPDGELDLSWLEGLLDRVSGSIKAAPDRVRYQMNGCVISIGCFVKPLTVRALQAAARIGTVTADLGPNSCQVPDAASSIRKVAERGGLGKKRRSAKC